MAILGTQIDITTITKDGSDGGGVALETQAHALGVAPDAVVGQLRSVEDGLGAVTPLYVGGDADLVTIGFVYAQAGSAPAIMADVIKYNYHTLIR